ncbi:hypothetical protein IJ768_01335 [Candidatus Saccharibacteria bacterium]|nr:hypothetical protein [Candidatus Saccharibacteria bacterium]
MHISMTDLGAGGIAGSAIIFYIISVAACWKIFNKAGVAGWKALIPVYNEFLAFKIVGISDLFWLQILTSVALQLVCSMNGLDVYAKQETLNNYDYAGHPAVIIAMLISLVINIYVNFRLASNMSKVFKKSTGMLIVLFVFRDLGQIILGFGSAKYDKKVAKELGVEFNN